MNKAFYVFRLLLLAGAATVYFTSCGKDEPQNIEVTSIELNSTAISLAVGLQKTLTATVLPDDATDKTLTWESSNTTVASVENGVVTAKGSGTATITAKASNNLTATCEIIVFETSKSEVTINGVTWATRNVNTPGTFAAKHESTGMFYQWGKKVGWSTSAPYTSAPQGNQWDDNIYTESVVWEALNDPCPAGWCIPTRDELRSLGEGIWTDDFICSGAVGRIFGTVPNQIFLPATGYITSKLPDSDGIPKRYAVNESGTYHSKNTHRSDGSSPLGTICLNFMEYSCEIGVYYSGSAEIGRSIRCVKTTTVEPTSVSLNKTTLALTAGNSETLTATVAPSNATDKTVTWISSNTSVATVDANGKVTAVKAGSATITAKAGDKTAVCTVTVSDATIVVSSVSLNKTTLALTVGNSETLTATVTPSNATDKTVTWVSNNTSVATVDANGKVTAKAKGTATITAKAGDKTASCTVTVSDVALIKLDYSELQMVVGEEFTLNATTTPPGQVVDWQSSKTSIATVEGPYSQGKVIAKAPGTITINATYKGQTVSCEITVYAISATFTYKGVTWASKNVDVPGTFTTSASDQGMMYQWNRKIGWTSEGYSLVSVPAGGSLSGGAQGTSWTPENDPCPTGWRLPTYEECKQVSTTPWLAVLNDRRISGNNCDVLIHTKDNIIVFSDGAGINALGSTRNPKSVYWTSTPNGEERAYGFDKRGGISPGYDISRNAALSVRCVRN
ncbi:Ig-like domain-containing protein [Dysgonomonas termitidis]|uniref:Ig-like domain-containing protein n=1 Tax=Dysgonomonas termitidis TaxID=1516126 RepID=A0ABV9KZ83_9BACT